jgi:Tfp pilus assembly protein PilF/transglutaminase-like putative cysteine protease
MIHAARLAAAAIVVLGVPAVTGAQGPPARNGDPGSSLSAQIESFAVRDTIERDGRVERTTDVRVLVRDPAGVAEFGQIGGPFIEGMGEVDFERVSIEKPDGRRLPIENGRIEDLNPFGMSAAPVAADFRFRRMTIPGLAPGDRLTFRIVTRQKPLIPNVSAGEFKFVPGPMASEQTYELDAPSDLRVSVWRRPDLGAAFEERAASGDRTVRRLALHAPIELSKDNIAALLVEPDVIYSTFRSWEEVGAWWWGVAHDRFQPDAAVRAEAQRLAKAELDPGARLEALYAFVSGQIRYLNVGFGVGRFEPRPASEVLASRYGDCKGKHVLLAALGAAAGIEVLPALVHTSRKDLNDAVPGPTQFDHILSVVRKGPDPAGWLWLDTTTDLARPGQIAPSLRGKRVVLMAPEGARVVKTPERLPFKSRWVLDSKGSIDPAGPIRARVRVTYRNDIEPVMRAAFRASPRDKWDEVGKDLAKEWSKGEVSEVGAGDPADLEEPFWVEYSVVHKMSGKTLEKPWSLWVPLPDLSLPAPEAEAKPGDPVVEFFGDEVVLRARFDMPEGMHARVPLSLNLDRPFAAYRSTYAVEGHTLTVERVLQIKMPKVPADQRTAYEAFRTAVNADHRQEFPIEAFHSAGGGAAETADDLNSAGNDALDDGDAKKAEDLFRKATEKDSGHKWAWNNLGRALRKQSRYEEAKKAFDRQIEINPYDEYAYGNRGALLAFDLARSEEGEKDMLKQIEVAPFKAGSYRDLSWIRTWQGKFQEASDLLERAAAAQPKDGEVLHALAWARMRAKKGDVGDAARRALQEDGRPRGAISAARALGMSGDAAGAGEMARKAAADLIAELQPGADRDQGYNYERDALYLGEAWRLIGAAALAAGDLVAAERYLTASYDLAFTTDASADLIRLRERQGRARDAAGLRAQAAPFVHAEERARPLRPSESPLPTKSPGPVVVTSTGEGNTIGLRHIKQLGGPAPSEDFYVRIQVTVDAAGRLTDVRAMDPKDKARIAAARGRVVGQTFPSGNPDKAKFTLTRGGTLSCYKGTMCYLAVDLLAEQTRTLER